MTKQQTSYLAAFSLILGFLLIGLMRNVGNRNNTSITLSENKHSVNISAEFPEDKSGKVHDFLRHKLNLADLPDLSHLEIKDYSTPDNRLRFSIRSMPGSLELSMNREQNSRDAYRTIKETAEEIKHVLTSN